MALGAISGAAYKDTLAVAQKAKADISNLQQSTVDLSITVIPESVPVSESNQTGTGDEKGQKEKTASEKQIKDAITNVNNKLREHLTRLEFTYHDDIKRISIKVIDSETDKVIKEIPPEDTLEMIEKIWKLQGLLVDEKR
ncbi:MAG TPA: flagellar protein FlaG [Mobilitalea sp.]|nr:flagellar protein FlaG [Mobilitalea sp.]